MSDATNDNPVTYRDVGIQGWAFSGKNLVITLGFKPYTISDPDLVTAISKLMAEGKWQDVRTMVVPEERPKLLAKAHGDIVIENGTVTYKGNIVDTYLAHQMVRLYEQHFDIQPMLNFMERLMRNPSYKAVKGLYEWLERGEFSITPDGKIIGWKIVTGDYLDYHTKTINNSIGQKPSMPRNKVDDNSTNHCSKGFHFCSSRYLESFHAGDPDRRIMVLEIDPEHVVSFPDDGHYAKGRCCEYEVVGEMPRVDRNSSVVGARAVPMLFTEEAADRWSRSYPFNEDEDFQDI